MDNSAPGITQLLLDWSNGNERALSDLFPLVYEELRSMAQSHLRRERSAHTLQKTALVHEAFIRLVDQKNVDWRSRAQFFGLASQMMRRILVDYARKRRAAKRDAPPPIDIAELESAEESGHEAGWSSLLARDAGVDFEAIDEALKRLEALDARQSRLVELRFFGGLSIEEASQVLEISPATAKRDWAFARAWLQRELGDPATA